MEVARALQSAGAQVDQVVKYGMELEQTFLFYASCAGHLTGVLTALILGAQADMQNAKGGTALHCTLSYGHMKVVDAGGRGRANPDLLDSDGHAPLHPAAWGGHLEVVHTLQRARGG